jgi:hypothetical protein
MLDIRFPWEIEPAPVSIREPPAPEEKPVLKRRGRRPAAATASENPVSPAWLYHHLTITGPADGLTDFREAAKGPGIIPWRVDYAAVEEDIFHRAVAGRGGRNGLSIEGCHILARQFRERIEARDARAAALIGRSRACPLDLHVLRPIPAEILNLGSKDPGSLDWLVRHWGTRDKLRKVADRENPSAGRRLPARHGVLSYGFFTAGDTPQVAAAALHARWPVLRFVLTPRPGG